MKYFFITLICCLTIKAGHAENVPLPTSILGIDDVITEFRTQWATKLVDLGKNYISTINPDSVYYTDSKAITCNNVINNPGERLAGIKYLSDKKDNELYEKVIYQGCNRETALVEEVVTKGTNLEPAKFSDLLKGKRTFDLKDNETFRSYRILNEVSEAVFSVQIEKVGNNKYVNYSILGQKFLSMIYEYTPTATNVVVSYYGYSVNYVRKFWRRNSTMNITNFTNKIFAKKSEMVVYLDGDGKAVSLTNFTNTFNDVILQGALDMITSIIEYHTYYFPETEATKSGNQNQRFLEQLRGAQTRLLTNTEINLVKNLLQEFINAAELGQIVDNRPKPSN